ncbi:hypothetical protein [Sphingopyxis sp.]|uniref:hypothetical protein n=1 Tax=Sphingopyxis sp. TaxID=1908224 RepID=UPI002B498074|nr:hypothetical protein [Sphingopyxis sp.]HJS11158.1 hypothetical protein [Sphingopyxis sp.]
MPQKAAKIETGFAGRQPGLWAAAFAVALFAIAYCEHRGLLGGWRSLPFVAAATLLLVPMTKAANNRQAAAGALSPATRRYNRRMLIWSLGYVLCLGTAMTVRNYLHPQGALLWGIAVLPSVPMIFFVWTLARYVVEEEDEYLRYRQTSAALIGLALVLLAGTLWGFLETFGVAPHVPAWWVVPVWAIGLGLGQMIMASVDRRADRT